MSTKLGRQEIPVEKISGLLVERIDKGVELELPKPNSRSNVPFRRDQISRKETANEWQHLQKIADELFPYQSSGLLLSCNCPRAINPREVILGKGEGPCAVRTLLGWGIYWPRDVPASKDEADEVDDDFVTCNRVIWHTRQTAITQAANVSKKLNVSALKLTSRLIGLAQCVKCGRILLELIS